jgi:hypothetical protein
MRAHPEFAREIAPVMENLALQHNFPRTAKAFRNFYIIPPTRPNFNPPTQRSRYADWLKTNMSVTDTATGNTKMICCCLLNVAQSLGALEFRSLGVRDVSIYVSLPSIAYRRHQPYHLGRGMTYVAKHPDALRGKWYLQADVGTPEYKQILSRKLNDLSQDRLWWLASQMAARLHERYAVNRLFAMMDYHFELMNPEHLKHIFGETGPLSVENKVHVRAVNTLADHKRDAGQYLSAGFMAIRL